MSFSSKNLTATKNRVIPLKEIKAFQTKILSWYKKNKRDLPWRRTRDPYRILVSEIMLQQTQVSRVIPKYAAWLEAFPTLESLAKAKTSEVLRLWSGLGYNRRALYLQKTAQILVEQRLHLGQGATLTRAVFPQTIEELKKLPGIGEYTAAAVACFAFDQQVAVIDTNVRKVIMVHFCHPEASAEGSHEILLRQPADQNDIKEIADQLLPKGRAAEWNQALMDYASAMLKQEKIPLVKQSTFKNSNRYYRGQIIKLLLEKQEVRVEELVNIFQKDEGFMKMIILTLVKDGLVKEKQGKLEIASLHSQ